MKRRTPWGLIQSPPKIGLKHSNSYLMKLILENIAWQLHFTLQTALKLIQPLNLPFKVSSNLPVHIHKPRREDSNDVCLTLLAGGRGDVFHMWSWLNALREIDYRQHVCFVNVGSKSLCRCSPSSRWHCWLPLWRHSQTKGVISSVTLHWFRAFLTCVVFVPYV